MTIFPRRPVKLNCHCDSSSNTGNHAKEKSQPESISNAEYDRVRHRSSKQPQRPVFAAQQIVSKIQRAQHVQARCRDAHARQQVMIDGMPEMHAMIVEGKLLPLQKLLSIPSEFPCISV